MIRINQPIFGEEEKQAVLRVFESGVLTSSSLEGGPEVRQFEKALANYVGVKDAVAVNSGTAALYAALLACEVGEGDEVLVPSFTFAATANAVLFTGAKPVFVDIDPTSYTMDWNDFERKITNRSRAAIPVHLYGYPADMDAILDAAREHDLHVIEDAAQSLGATYRNKQTGSLGQVGCFSFYPSKVITCGEGGAVTTNDAALGERLRMLRNHGTVHGNDTGIRGFNFRMPEAEAAVARAQLGKLERFLERRRRHAENLTALLEGVAGIALPHEDDGRRSNWYLYTVAVAKERDRVVERLRAQGVEATVYYPVPIHRMPLYERLGFGYAHLPNTMLAAEHVLSLPVHPDLSDEQLTQVASSFREAVIAAM